MCQLSYSKMILSKNVNSKQFDLEESYVYI